MSARRGTSDRAGRGWRTAIPVGVTLLAAGVLVGVAIGRSTVGDSAAGSQQPASPALAAAMPVVRVTSAGGGLTPTEIAAAATPGVVSIMATVSVDSRFGTREGVAEGSGFVLDRQGRILTNEHVVEGASRLHVSFADGTKVRATVLSRDPPLDLAVIKVSVRSATLHPLVLGSSDSLRLGDPVVAIGNPFNLERSVSVGVVSGLHRQITAPNGFSVSNAVQTDAAINHGNSGGPLLDRHARVVGLNAQIADSGVNANVGVGFAVAIDALARSAIRQLEAGRTVRHSWLGVSLDDIDAILATSGRVHSTSGALITGVVSGGPAAKAGIRGGSTAATIDGAAYCLGGDIVVRAAGRQVTSPGDLQTAIGAYAPGATVALTVVRAGGVTKTLSVKLGMQPTSAPETTTGCG